MDNSILDDLTELLNAELADVTVSNEYRIKGAKLPYVYVKEFDNYQPKRYMGTDNEHGFTVQVFEIEVITDIYSGIKVARELMTRVDAVITSAGLLRTGMIPSPNDYNDSVNRIRARYDCVVDKNKTIYRR